MGGQHTERLQQTGRGLIWLGYSLCCVWLALALAWWLYARIDYSYPLWYDMLDIDRHIAEYAPHNARKPGFAQLPPEQHYQAFAQISRAVHDNGKGLGEIVYRGPGGRDIRLLDRDERVHLEDVARLLRLGGYSALIALLGWLPLAMALARTGLPGWRARLAGAALMSVAMVGIRSISDTEPPRRTVFWFGVFSSLISAVPLLWVRPLPGPEHWPWLVAIGVVATAAQITMTTAYKLASPGRIGIYNYTSVVWAALLGLVFWAEALHWSTLVGTALIFAAGVWNLERKGRVSAAHDVPVVSSQTAPDKSSGNPLS